MTKNINLIYFSPTGNTRRTLEAMAKAISDNISAIDLTCLDKVQQWQFSKDDFVILGMPVYGGRIPAVAKQRIENIEGIIHLVWSLSPMETVIMTTHCLSYPILRRHTDLS